MKNVPIFVAAYLMIALSVAGQSKVDPRTTLFQAMRNINVNESRVSDGENKTIKAPARFSDWKTETVDVFITMSEDMTELELVELGLRDIVVVDNIAVGTVCLSDFANLEDCDKISGISMTGKPHLLNNLSRAASHVDEVHAGTDGLPRGYNGEGVIVSLFDQGIEPGHINFLTKDRSECRVRRIWHYNSEYDNLGNLQTTESEYYTPESIEAFATDDSTQTHGTHTLGILAGSFGEEADEDYSGMAPASDIVIGCGTLMYSNVVRAIKRFSEYAKEENKPLVVNLSFGDNIGPHDGTDAFPQLLNSLAEEIPIFMSSGNEGELKIALNRTFSEEDSIVRTVITPRSTIRNYLGSSWEAACEVQVWSEDGTPFTIETGLWNKSEQKWVFSLPIAPDGEASYIANGDYAGVSNYQNDDFDYLYTNSAIGVSTGYDPNNNRYTADIWYMLNKLTNHIDRNIIPALFVRGENGKRVDIYCDGDYNEFDDSNIDGWDNGGADGSISNIACGPNTISVGSYCTRMITEPSVEGEVSPFSSWGILPDGRNLPNILAPGDCIASSMSTPFTASDYYSSNTYPAVYGVMYGDNNPFYWTIQQGTSQSSPAMAGIAALWLQANPYLTPAQIKQIAIETAAPTPTMTAQCGAGKVDALAGIKVALSMVGVEDIYESGRTPFLICRHGSSYTVENACGEYYKMALCDMSGKIVLTRECEGDISVNIDSNSFSKGIYILDIVTENNGKYRYKLVF